MQPHRARAIDGEPAHQHDTRLRARPHDHGNARQLRLKSLAEEPRQQPPDQPMFEMHLHHVGRVATIVQHRRLERDRSYRRIAPPLAQAFAMLAGTDPKVIERIVPAGILGEGGIGGIQMEGCDIADGLPASAVEREPRTRQCGGRHPLQILGIDADPLP